MKIVIVGAGEVGFHIARHLAHENKDVVVIDSNQEAIDRVANQIDVQVTKGSGSSPTVLENVGIQNADILLAVTNSDEINLAACLITNLISPSTKKLARIRSADFDLFHEALCHNAPHIDTIINPEIEVVKTIVNLITVPGAIDIGDFADGRIKLVGVRLRPDSKFNRIKLADISALTGRINFLIAAMVRNETLIIPSGADMMLVGDTIYLICENDHLKEVMTVFEQDTKPLRRALIIGGGRIGARLAATLEKHSISAKIIEKDLEQCHLLAENLKKTVVLQGDGTDQTLLSEEGIRDTDIVITLTGDEETNIIGSLLAKQLGVRKTITKISKFAYFPLMSTIGIDQVINPRLSAINTILHYVRRGKILSVFALKGEQGEILEAVALETSAIVGKPLREVSFPTGGLVTAIIREDQVIIPSGESIIQPNDRIIIFTLKKAIAKIEKMLSVKLEYF